MEVLSDAAQHVLCVRRWNHAEEVGTVLHCGETSVSLALPGPVGHWHKRLDAVDAQWQGRGRAVPLTLHSAGAVRRTLPPTMVVLFVQGQAIAHGQTKHTGKASCRSGQGLHTRRGARGTGQASIVPSLRRAIERLTCTGLTGWVVMLMRCRPSAIG